MHLRTLNRAGLTSLLLCLGCAATSGGGGGGVAIAKDASGDGAIASDTKVAETTGGDALIGDSKASDTKSGDASDTADSGGMSALLGCLQTSCASQMAACQASATCGTALACIYACPIADNVCPNKCMDPLKNDLAALGAIDAVSKCEQANCETTSLPANTCGNAKCEGSESSWCSLDCDSTIKSLVYCADGKCTPTADACILDADCNTAMNCVMECTDPSCWANCPPSGAASLSLYNAMWNCTQNLCTLYLPQGSP